MKANKNLNSRINAADYGLLHFQFFVVFFLLEFIILSKIGQLVNDTHKFDESQSRENCLGSHIQTQTDTHTHLLYLETKSKLFAINKIFKKKISFHSFTCGIICIWLCSYVVCEKIGAIVF